MFNIKMIAAVVIYAFLAVDINSKRYLGDFLYGFIIILKQRQSLLYHRRCSRDSKHSS